MSELFTVYISDDLKIAEIHSFYWPKPIYIYLYRNQNIEKGLHYINSDQFVFNT